MQGQRSIGIVDWVRNNEFGVLRDCISGAEVFFHCRQNPNIGKVSIGTLCAFETAPDRRRGGLIAVDLLPTTELDPSVLYAIVHDNLEALLGKPFLPDLLKRLKDGDVQRICDKLLYDIDQIATEEKYVQATKLIKLSKPLGEALWRKVCERLHDAAISYYRVKLWYYGHVDVLDEEALRECYFQIEELGRHLNPKAAGQVESGYRWSIFGARNSEDANLTRAMLSKRVPSAVLLSLFLRTIAECVRIADIGEEPCAEVLRASVDWQVEQRTALTDAIWEKGGAPIRLQLWLYGHADRFDYGAFKILFLTLNAEDQFRFVRNLFREAERKRFDLSVTHLDELARFDEDFAAECDLDCSIDIALNALSDLAAGRALTEERNIGRVLVRHFSRKAFQKFQIRGLFEECEGRCYAFSDGKGPNGQPQVRLHRSQDKPQGVTFCEGRLAPQLDNTHGLKFWWCRNTPCFSPSHKDHGVEEWEKYTVRDMLRILQVPYDPEQFQVFQGMVNRVNVLLEHLNCRSCDRIMMPKGQSNFGFYRASRFVCANDDCANKQEVYLNHCLNGKCQYIVDSRDSAKCPNGLHVCTKCHSCCSTKSFARRIENLKNVGQDVPENLLVLVEQNQGHAEQGRSFCFGCGSELVGGTEPYRKALKWLMDNREVDARIKASGQRPKDGGWWFIVDFPEEKYSSLADLGFEILPTRNGNGRMVSTPFGGREHTKGKCPNDACQRFGISC